ncbi:MAG: hypothetical protein ABUK01_02505 [Leptospirales bacterium]
MSVSKLSYQEARKRMQPGDVIAFGGNSHISEIIKFATFSDVSHVATVIQTKIPDDDSGRFFNQIIEATGHGGGVKIERFSDAMEAAHGDIWWLPLKKEIRENSFDQSKFFNFLFNQAKLRKPYDLSQAIKSAIDIIDTLPFGLHGPGHNREDFSKFFCSELVAAGLEASGAVGNMNASEVTPIELCRWSIYEKEYYQLKGSPENKIKRYNSLAPELWNE